MRRAADTRPIPYRPVADCLAELGAAHGEVAARHRASFSWPTPARSRTTTERLDVIR